MWWKGKISPQSHVLFSKQENGRCPNDGEAYFEYYLGELEHSTHVTSRDPTPLGQDMANHKPPIHVPSIRLKYKPIVFAGKGNPTWITPPSSPLSVHQECSPTISPLFPAPNVLFLYEVLDKYHVLWCSSSRVHTEETLCRSVRGTFGTGSIANHIRTDRRSRVSPTLCSPEFEYVRCIYDVRTYERVK